MKLAAVAVSGSQLRTLKPSRLLSQPPPVRFGRQAAAMQSSMAPLSWGGAPGIARGSGAQPPGIWGGRGRQPTCLKKAKSYSVLAARLSTSAWTVVSCRYVYGLCGIVGNLQDFCALPLLRWHGAEGFRARPSTKIPFLSQPLRQRGLSFGRLIMNSCNPDTWRA